MKQSGLVDPKVFNPIFGQTVPECIEKFNLAKQGELAIPEGLTTAHLLAYREIALRYIATFLTLNGEVPMVQMYRLAIIQRSLENLSGR